MIVFAWLLLFLTITLVFAFLRWPLWAWTLASAGALVACSLSAATPNWLPVVGWLLFLPVAVMLNVTPLRRRYLSAPVLVLFRKILPRLSETEQVALEAGTVWWEGDLFSGKPDWKKLLSIPVGQLSEEEQAFLDGPVEELCSMVDEWEINHQLQDLPERMWRYIRDNGFFGMIIPKKYGGLGFSALAHSEVLVKLASRNTTVSATVSVPNSLGPAELLHRYGTQQQKDHYLPRLAKGEEIPCFALTGPTAGSDATSIPDFGIICKGKWEGEEVLGMRLTFDKRYITLAPVATLIGLAFQLYDPDRLLGNRKDLGITLALIPRGAKGVEAGTRQMPLDVPFQNGPVRGKDVFVPLESIIGGPKMAGSGWRMLVECLSVGRAISLPSTSTGAALSAAWASGAYARIRRQFNVPVGRFEGVEEVLARILGRVWLMDSTRRMTAGAVDLGESPAVPGAIAKYHVTEMGRQVMQDAMDVHGGKGIMLGPNNYLGRNWQGAPINVTVEGANILTRNMIIFGQGVIRCHPFVLREMEAAFDDDEVRGLEAFDPAFFGHLGFALSNGVRSLLLGLSGGHLASVPRRGPFSRYYRQFSRYSAVLALCSDTAMGVLGGSLKRRERLSARLGDVLSWLYIGSTVLKRFEDAGRPVGEEVVTAWCCEYALVKIQDALDGFLSNFPVKTVAWSLRALVFPFGRHQRVPGDRRDHLLASSLMQPGDIRDTLGTRLYTTAQPNNPIGMMEQTFRKVIDAEVLEARVHKAHRKQEFEFAVGADLRTQLKAAVAADVLGEAEVRQLLDAEIAVADVIAVDEFEPSELGASRISTDDKGTQAA
ncbi:MAG: acyl-CoA dehydrogenase [Gammaproteobacteria bacterium]|nr:MAG: acyl-CoA dehydrogenase [Gammaproteobacteria bacterium]